MNIPAPASRVWATPELRSFIIDQMELDAVRKSLTLSRDTFPAMVRSLYRHFQYKHYSKLLSLSVSVSLFKFEKLG